MPQSSKAMLSAYTNTAASQFISLPPAVGRRMTYWAKCAPTLSISPRNSSTRTCLGESASFVSCSGALCRPENPTRPVVTHLLVQKTLEVSHLVRAFLDDVIKVLTGAQMTQNL